jgi:hypothetical protein
LATEPTLARIDPEQLLKACFGKDEERRLAFNACAALDNRNIDAAARRLLPILYQRWGTAACNTLIDLAHRTYLTTWRQNQERMARLGTLLQEFEQAGIECMLLKGAAITLGHYRDYGLRNMGDFDLLIHQTDIEHAAHLLLQNGWVAEDGCTIEAIQRQSRVRHAWQFILEGDQNCDLHWRPLARCYSPRITEMFWRGSETIDVVGHAVKIPCSTDQFFHVSVHAMHWEWTRNLYWVADALTLLDRAKIDWSRLVILATGAAMRMQLIQALTYLTSQFQCCAPEEVLDMAVPGWEKSEYRVLQKPCPLGYFDSIAWHRYHFRRLREFDSQWSESLICVAFPQYIATFLEAADWRSFLTKIWFQLALRRREPS